MTESTRFTTKDIDDLLSCIACAENEGRLDGDRYRSLQNILWEMRERDPKVPSKSVYVEFSQWPGGPEGPFVEVVPAEQSSVFGQEWRPNPLGGGWEVSDDGWWRLGPFVDAS